MPVVLSKRGGVVKSRATGRVEKRFSSRTKARAYAQAVNMAHARKRGYRVPAKRRKGGRKRRR